MQEPYKTTLPWDGPRRLWSFCEMIQHVCGNFSGMYASLETYLTMLQMQMNVVFAGVKALNPNDPRASGIPFPELDANTKKAIATFVAGFAVQECKFLGLTISEQKAFRLKNELDANHRYTAESMVTELRGLKETIVMELATRKFAYIAPPYDQYFERERLFGDIVHEKFSDARQDVKDAGNAIAASLPTAGVFHLMRVSEYGLRSLARKLKVKITHTGKPCPLEFGEWDKVITGAKNKIAEARKRPAGPKRQAQLESWSRAADHCEYMKDIWRNNVSHTRKPYSHTEAIAVLERVRDFMQFLGKAL